MAAVHNGPPGPQPDKSLSNKKGLGWALACKWETRGPLLGVTGSDPDPARGSRAEMILSHHSQWFVSSEGSSQAIIGCLWDKAFSCLCRIPSLGKWSTKQPQEPLE